MISEALCAEAKAQVKRALAQACYSANWNNPIEGRMSLINHPLVPKGQAYLINTAYLGMDKGWQEVRGIR